MAIRTGGDNRKGGRAGGPTGGNAPVRLDGKDVPLIVRQEKGVINRSAYLINVGRGVIVF